MESENRNFHFFAMMDRMRFIQRWSLMRSTTTENLAEHSLMVGMIAHVMAVLRNQGTVEQTASLPEVDAGQIAVMAMYHDAPEIITGDLPTPVKYYDKGIRDAYRRVEQSATERLLALLPDPLVPIYSDFLFENDSEEWRFVKAADKISAYLKCLQEVKAGNSEFSLALEQCREKVQELELPEADYFMKHFADSYTLTIDELNPPAVE